MNRRIREIAEDIWEDWGEKISPYAKPYLEAMNELDTPEDYFGADSGDLIIRYFLANATGWRGPVAREIKKELYSIICPRNRKR